MHAEAVATKPVRTEASVSVPERITSERDHLRFGERPDGVVREGSERTARQDRTTKRVLSNAKPSQGVSVLTEFHANGVSVKHDRTRNARSEI